MVNMKQKDIANIVRQIIIATIETRREIPKAGIPFCQGLPTLIITGRDNIMEDSP